MKNFRCKVITKLNSKIVSFISLISFGLICKSDISEAMIPTPTNSVFRLFSRMTTSIGRFFRSSKSNQPKTHKISKSFDSSFSKKSVLSTTFDTPESNKTSKIKLTKFSDNSTGKSSTSISNDDVLHKTKGNRKNFYEVDQSYSTSEPSTPTNTPPTPRRSRQAVSPSPSLIIRNFEASLRRRDEEFNKMFEQNMKLKKEDFKGSQEILKNIRKEVNIKFLGHSSKP